MKPPSTAETSYTSHDEIVARQNEDRAAEIDEAAVPNQQLLFRLGRVPVQLSPIEFRIIDFLSQAPYKAFRAIRRRVHSGSTRGDNAMESVAIPLAVKA